MGARGCTGTSKRTGKPCGAPAISGTTKCPVHAGKSTAKAKAEGAVRLEVQRWGLDSSVTPADPGTVLLRLVTQSAQRAEMLAGLLQDAYDAAERLRRAHESEALVEAGEGEGDVESPAARRAREDLRRVFTTGGVSALVGQTYSLSASGHLYATGEAVRGLARLESEERDRCATFAAKAIAAGLAERQVRLAERQGALVVEILRAAVAGELPEVRDRVLHAAGTRLRSIEAAS
jgi:hypothetical protein